MSQSHPFSNWRVVTRGMPPIAERPGNFADALAYCLDLTCGGFRGRLEKRRGRIGCGRLAMKTSRENTNVGAPFLIARVLHGFGRV